jgi:hypothetical protein
MHLAEYFCFQNWSSSLMAAVDQFADGHTRFQHRHVGVDMVQAVFHRGNHRIGRALVADPPGARNVDADAIGSRSGQCRRRRSRCSARSAARTPETTGWCAGRMRGAASRSIRRRAGCCPCAVPPRCRLRSSCPSERFHGWQVPSRQWRLRRRCGRSAWRGCRLALDGAGAFRDFFALHNLKPLRSSARRPWIMILSTARRRFDPAWARITSST